MAKSFPGGKSDPSGPFEALEDGQLVGYDVKKSKLVSAGAGGSLATVSLQDGTPGTPQVGNINIDGRIVARGADIAAPTGQLGVNVTSDNASAIVGTSQSGSGVAGVSVEDRGVDGTSQGGPSGYFQSGSVDNGSPTLMAVRATSGALADLIAATTEGQVALFRVTATGGIFATLPTSNPGPGLLWNDGGTVKVGT